MPLGHLGGAHIFQRGIASILKRLKPAPPSPRPALGCPGPLTLGPRLPALAKGPPLALAGPLEPSRCCPQPRGQGKGGN